MNDSTKTVASEPHHVPAVRVVCERGRGTDWTFVAIERNR